MRSVEVYEAEIVTDDPLEGILSSAQAGFRV